MSHLCININHSELFLKRKKISQSTPPFFFFLHVGMCVGHYQQIIKYYNLNFNSE